MVPLVNNCYESGGNLKDKTFQKVLLGSWIANLQIIIYKDCQKENLRILVAQGAAKLSTEKV